MLSNDVVGADAYTECDKKTPTKKKSNTLPNVDDIILAFRLW